MRKAKTLLSTPLTIVGAIVVLACVYVLSYGPAYWCVWTTHNPQLETTAAILYSPLDLVVRYGPRDVTEVLVRYCDLWYPG